MKYNRPQSEEHRMQSHSHPNLSYKGEGWGCESKERETTYLYVGWNITLVTGALCPVNSYLQGETERSELNYLLNNNLSLDGNLSGGLGIQSVDSLVLRVAPKINRTQVPSQTQRLHTTLPAHTSLHHLLLHLRQLHF